MPGITKKLPDLLMMELAESIGLHAGDARAPLIAPDGDWGCRSRQQTATSIQAFWKIPLVSPWDVN